MALSGRNTCQQNFVNLRNFTGVKLSIMHLSLPFLPPACQRKTINSSHFLSKENIKLLTAASQQSDVQVAFWKQRWFCAVDYIPLRMKSGSSSISYGIIGCACENRLSSGNRNQLNPSMPGLSCSWRIHCWVALHIDLHSWYNFLKILNFNVLVLH